jgi:hypothetical protein
MEMTAILITILFDDAVVRDSLPIIGAESYVGTTGKSMRVGQLMGL